MTDARRFKFINPSDRPLPSREYANEDQTYVDGKVSAILDIFESEYTHAGRERRIRDVLTSIIDDMF